nr:copia protein [Tanacetum cinerariifolium]
MKVKESLNVTFDKSSPPIKLSPLVDDDVGEEEAIRENTKIVNINNEEDESIEVDEIVHIKESKNHPLIQKFGLEDSKPTKTPMLTEMNLIKDDEADSVDSSKYRGTGIETVVYANSDHAVDYVDRKSTSGVCTFMRCCLTSWFAKKQRTLAISTIEAEYVSARKGMSTSTMDETSSHRLQQALLT